jgi:hypothetical protein
MKTNVTQTSIEAHKQTTTERMTLKKTVAEYALSETRQGRTVWIGKIAKALGLEKSTASARLNEIKKDGVELHGVKYEIKLVRSARPIGESKKVEQWALVLPSKKESEQTQLF